MFDLKAILQLYTNVLCADVVRDAVGESDILAGLSNMSGVYAQGFGPCKVLDFNRTVNRCAYLHKYAPLYTAIVRDTVQRILADGAAIRFRLESGYLRMCSLGGGPGTDVVGVLAALDAAFGPSRWYSSVSIVDYMEGWKSTFGSVVRELRRFGYRAFASRFVDEAFSWNYVEGDLLDTRNHQIWDAVSCSSLVTIVNCLSTFRPDEARKAIRKTFRALSYGSFILFIDDDAEELNEIIASLAQEYQMIPIFGPLRNLSYSFDELKVTKFEHTSCYQATVSSLLLLKPLISPKAFIFPRFQVFVPMSCAKCGDLEYVCSKCAGSACKSFRPPLCKHAASENEFQTPLSSRSASPDNSRPSESTQPDVAGNQAVSPLGDEDSNNLQSGVLQVAQPVEDASHNRISQSSPTVLPVSHSLMENIVSHNLQSSSVVLPGSHSAADDSLSRDHNLQLSSAVLPAGHSITNDIVSHNHNLQSPSAVLPVSHSVADDGASNNRISQSSSPDSFVIEMPELEADD